MVIISLEDFRRLSISDSVTLINLLNRYNIKLKNKPDEERIMEMTLGEGYHPSVGTADTMAPIYNENDEGVLVDAFEEFMKEIPDIFNAEMDKLM